MNQAVENIYAEMFAPHAIPIEVITLYDKVNYFVKKEGLPGMRKFDMCMIAGIALNKPVKRDENTKQDLDGHEIVDTSEDFDIDNPIENAEMIVDDAESSFEPTPLDDLPAPPDEGGKMDAPKAPDPNQKRKGHIEALLSKMTKDELLAHATDICGVSVNKLAGRQRGKASKAEIDKIGKQKIIKAILESSK
jgi:hypothetical protein